MSVESHENTHSLPVSNEVAAVIKRAQQLVPPGDRLEDTHIIAAISETPCRGQDLLHALTLMNFGRLQTELRKFTSRTKERSPQAGAMLSPDGTTTTIDTTVVELFNKAQQAQVEESLRTDELIRAAFDVTDTYIGTAITAVGGSRFLDQVSLFQQSRIIRRRESGSHVIKIQVQQDTSSSKSPASEIVTESTERYLDALARTKTNDIPVLTVVDSWLGETLQAASYSHRVVIGEDYPGQGKEIMIALAKELSQETAPIFPFNSIIIPDEYAMDNEPVETIQEAIAQAVGGILYIPNAHKHLDRNHLYGQKIDQFIRRAGKKVRIVLGMPDKEYAKIGNGGVLEGYQVVMPELPRTEDAKKMLASRKDQLEAEFKTQGLAITIADDALEAVCELAARYVHDQPTPVREIEILRETAFMLRVAHSSPTLRRLGHARVQPDAIIHRADIEIGIEARTGIPIAKEPPEKYIHMASTLSAQVIGQEAAVNAVTEVIGNAKAGLRNPKQPLGSFIFLGPSSVGKTELAKVLARFLYDTADEEQAMTTLDMSEYMEKHNVSRMIGPPPGYQGAEEGGQLTEALRKQPYQVVLADEIEKAHDDIETVFLQVLREGRLTDGLGRIARFDNSVVIATSNVGSRYYTDGVERTREELEELVMEEVRQQFRPEFLNRFNKIIIFNDLTVENLEQIVGILVKKENKYLQETGVQLKVSADVQKLIANKGWIPGQGAAGLDRAFTTLIRSRLSKGLLAGQYQKGDKVTATVENGEIILTKAK